MNEADRFRRSFRLGARDMPLILISSVRIQRIEEIQAQFHLLHEMWARGGDKKGTSWTRIRPEFLETLVQLQTATEHVILCYESSSTRQREPAFKLSLASRTTAS